MVNTAEALLVKPHTSCALRSFYLSFGDFAHGSILSMSLVYFLYFYVRWTALLIPSVSTNANSMFAAYFIPMYFFRTPTLGKRNFFISFLHAFTQLHNTYWMYRQILTKPCAYPVIIIIIIFIARIPCLNIERNGSWKIRKEMNEIFQSVCVCGWVHAMIRRTFLSLMLSQRFHCFDGITLAWLLQSSRRSFFTPFISLFVDHFYSFRHSPRYHVIVLFLLFALMIGLNNRCPRTLPTS